MMILRCWHTNVVTVPKQVRLLVLTRVVVDQELSGAELVSFLEILMLLALISVIMSVNALLKPPTVIPRVILSKVTSVKLLPTVQLFSNQTPTNTLVAMSVLLPVPVAHHSDLLVVVVMPVAVDIPIVLKSVLMVWVLVKSTVLVKRVGLVASLELSQALM
jgi:hypothetical protein